MLLFSSLHAEKAKSPHNDMIHFFLPTVEKREKKSLPEQPNKEYINISTEWHKSIHNAAHVDPIQ